MWGEKKAIDNYTISLKEAQYITYTLKEWNSFLINPQINQKEGWDSFLRKQKLISKGHAIK